MTIATLFLSEGHAFFDLVDNEVIHIAILNKSPLLNSWFLYIISNNTTQVVLGGIGWKK